jgi:hypothetical protein
MLALLTTFLLLLFPSLITAQSSTDIVYPTRASSGASTLQTGFGYKYMGCYNETSGVAGSGGVRALSGGSEAQTNLMDVGTCLNFCGGSKYAGLEYGEYFALWVGRVEIRRVVERVSGSDRGLR